MLAAMGPTRSHAVASSPAGRGPKSISRRIRARASCRGNGNFSLVMHRATGVDGGENLEGGQTGRRCATRARLARGLRCLFSSARRIGQAGQSTLRWH